MMPGGPLLECVVNVSEGRDRHVLAALATAGGRSLLDVHADPSHNRCVLTLGGAGPAVEIAARRVARCALDAIDLARHDGVHPRIGALDVVPWVSLERSGTAAGARVTDGRIGPAIHARNRFATWAASELSLPCFVYGPERQLPEVRRQAWRGVVPDFGPRQPHLTAGGTAVGARPLLVAYNLWLERDDVALASRIAKDVRGPHVRALGLPVAGGVQVSCNLLSPAVVGPGTVYDEVAAFCEVRRAELVGLAPRFVLDQVAPERWEGLDLHPDRTIEARLDRVVFGSPLAGDTAGGPQPRWA